MTDVEVDVDVDVEVDVDEVFEDVIGEDVVEDGVEVVDEYVEEDFVDDTDVGEPAGSWYPHPVTAAPTTRVLAARPAAITETLITVIPSDVAQHVPAVQTIR